MEAAGRSRRLRLEELKRRKQEAASAPRTNGANTHKDRRRGKDDSDELPGMIQFDDADIHALASGDASGLEDLFKSWSTAKLVRSFRVLDKRLRIDYDKLKDTVEKDVAGIEENVIREGEARRQEELDLHNIQPKRVNWDLKRDMNKKLAKLDRRDREARLILIRQRIAATAKDSAGGAERAQDAAARAVGSGELLGATEAVPLDDDSDASRDE